MLVVAVLFDVLRLDAEMLPARVASYIPIPWFYTHRQLLVLEVSVPREVDGNITIIRGGLV